MGIFVCMRVNVCFLADVLPSPDPPGRYSKLDGGRPASRRAIWSGRVHPIGHTPRELRDAGEGLFLQASQVCKLSVALQRILVM
jgi:hypothetical protein